MRWYIHQVNHHVVGNELVNISVQTALKFSLMAFAKWNIIIIYGPISITVVEVWNARIKFSSPNDKYLRSKILFGGSVCVRDKLATISKDLKCGKWIINGRHASCSKGCEMTAFWPSIELQSQTMEKNRKKNEQKKNRSLIKQILN